MLRQSHPSILPHPEANPPPLLHLPFFLSSPPGIRFTEAHDPYDRQQTIRWKFPMAIESQICHPERSFAPSAKRSRRTPKVSAMHRRPLLFHLNSLACASAFALFVSLPTSGQNPAQKSSTIPFIGCKADGQIGPQPAPRRSPLHLPLEPTIASRLAYYKGWEGNVVLGPRGWYCFETYGSNGSTLYVSPTPLDPKQFFDSNWKGFTGPVIQISSMIGDTSGRFEVARTIARVFPARRDFVNNIIAEGLDPASDFPFGPYPDDRLTYRSNELVEFITPPNRQGLGTSSWLLPNQQPILGVAMLTGEELSLTHLALRLPPAMDDLAPIIIHETEQQER